ncbi:MKL/myocardin-like protein 2, partial [Limulus polyphemus]|uniref:MKL/myocardin-like protein 2 n=1 Tax=Limulus polyphemus TaxID=6850 RepID=A0ABM1C2A1_LIMPO
MSNILKNKIQYRPDRQKLVHQHILEDTTIDPSLHEKQKQLKKARLTDNLNNRISHRPGPLELIKGNILCADERLTQAIKEGQITFRKTCEGETIQHPSPQLMNEEESSSDGALSSPQETNGQSHSSFPSLDTSETSPILESPNSNKTTSLSSPGSSPLSLHAVSTPCPPTTSSVTDSPCHGQSKDGMSGSRSRKKSKSKFQPKTRTIKFHEYKGPPSAQKNHTVLSSPVETTYELLLQQQQLFLQWQLEWRHKYPQIVVPSGFCNNLSSGEVSLSDLKAELKRRNLPVSGPKPQLIERLKTHSNVTPSTSTASSSAFTNVSSTVNTSGPSTPVSVGGNFLDNMPSVLQYTTDHDINSMSPVVGIETVTNEVPALPSTESNFEIYQVSNKIQPSPHTDAMDTEMNITLDVGESSTEEDIVRLQQKRIEELQLELQ